MIVGKIQQFDENWSKSDDQTQNNSGSATNGMQIQDNSEGLLLTGGTPSSNTEIAKKKEE